MDAALSGPSAIAREARDQTICLIASSCRPDERAELTRALRASGALTPALLLRSLLGGDRDLFAEALAELVWPAAAARRGLYRRAARGRLRRARPPGGPEERRPARLPRRARRDQNSWRRGWRRAQAGAGAKGHRRMRAARRSRARPRFWRCCGASPPRRRRRKPRISRARRRLPLRGGRLPQILDFSPVNDDLGEAPKLIADFGWPRPTARRRSNSRRRARIERG